MSSRKLIINLTILILAQSWIGAVPANATQYRVSKCECNEGFQFRQADGTDYVCVDNQASARVQIENSNGPSHKLENGYCESGYVWRDAWDGDGVCVTPEARSMAHAENARHTGNDTKFEVQLPYSGCYLK